MKKETPTFTPKQIANWRAYEKVRRSARYNMLTTQAQSATGLGEREYFFCIDHFDALQVAAAAQQIKEAS